MTSSLPTFTPSNFMFFNLPPAPKIYHIQESVDPKTLPESTSSYKHVNTAKDKGFDLILPEKIPSNQVPTTPGIVCYAFQLPETGSGVIRVRWGEHKKENTIYAEYNFGVSTFNSDSLIS